MKDKDHALSAATTQPKDQKRFRNGALKNSSPKARQQGTLGEKRGKARGHENGPVKQKSSKDSQSLGIESTKQEIPTETHRDKRSRYHPRTAQESTPTSQLTVEPRQDWFNTDLPEITPDGSGLTPDKALQRMLSRGKELLKEENQRYAARKASSSSFKFYSTIMSSGTLSDKVSALTLSFQESPLHNMQSLESLIGLAKKRSRSQAVQVLGALKDLFSAGSVLPSDRRLRPFAAQPALMVFPNEIQNHWSPPEPLPLPFTDRHVMIWAFEDWLKVSYFEIVKVLEVWCNDEIVFSRLKAVDYTYDLLREQPEQEANLLHLLVNKLGDPEKKVASRASYNLVQLQLPHPFMKDIIISTIESDILFKQSQSLHAKYYAVITLNQTVLSGHQQELVINILNIYFALFLLLLGNHTSYRSEQDTVQSDKPGLGKLKASSKSKLKGSAQSQDSSHELKEKIISATLTGINRAFPFASSKDEFFEKHLSTLFKITHSSNFNTSLQALMLIQQLCHLQTAFADRFYRTLYESLLDPRLLTTSKQTLYINLLYRALKADLDVKRVQAFVKRIAQVIAIHQPAFACAAIYLIKELGCTFPSLQMMIDQPETIDSDVEDYPGGRTLHMADAPLAGPGRVSSYDGRKRDPQFSNADKTCLWETELLLCHFHPSASLFASKLLEPKAGIDGKPDPSLHSLIGFLDRFVYRNPKKPAGGSRGTSVMQPHAVAAGMDLLVSAQSSDRKFRSPITDLGSRLDSSRMAKPDEAFFHQYFNRRTKGKDKARKRTGKDQESLGAGDGLTSDGGENEEEAAIWKALIDSKPGLEEDLDSDIDMESDLADLESAMRDSEDDDELPTDDDVFHTESEEEIDSDGESGERANGVKRIMKVDSVSSEDSASKGDRSKADKKRRKILKGLPTFASAEDYATLLQAGHESSDQYM